MNTKYLNALRSRAGWKGKLRADSPLMLGLGSLAALAASFALRHFGFELYDRIGTYPGDIWYIHMSYGNQLMQPVFFRIEYPVGSFLFFKVAALLTWQVFRDSGYASFLLMNSVLLSLFALGTTFLIWRIRLIHSQVIPVWRIWVFWILAPSFIFYSLLNYDMPAVFFALLAVYFHIKKSDDLSAATLGIGVAAKIFPLFLLPLFIWHKKPAEGVRYCLVAGGVWLMINLSFMTTDFQAWLFPYVWQTTREVTFDGLAYIIYHTLGSPSATLFLPVVYGATLLAIYYRRRAGFLRTMPDPSNLVIGFSAALLATFLLANRIFSPQYMLWMLPFLVLTPGISLTSFYIFETANVALALLLFGAMKQYPALDIALRVIRYIALIAIYFQALGWPVFKPGLKPSLCPARQPAPAEQIKAGGVRKSPVQFQSEAPEGEERTEQD